jgi:hypothetical protein
MVDAYLSPRLLVAGSVFAARVAACVRAGAAPVDAFDALLDESVWLEGRPCVTALLDVEAALEEAAALLGSGFLASVPANAEALNSSS